MITGTVGPTVTGIWYTRYRSVYKVLYSGQPYW